MKRAFSISLVLFLAITLLFLDNALAAPKIVFKDPQHDFGKIPEGEKVDHVFEFKNEGDEDLVIERVKPSCGCTVANIGESVIPPGGSGKLQMTYDSSGRGGLKHYSIYVFSNDPENPKALLEFTADVQSAINVEPKTVYFGDLSPGLITKKNTTVSSPDGQLFEIKKISVDSRTIDLSVIYDNESRSSHEVEVVPDTTDYIGEFDATLEMETDIKDSPKTRAYVRGRVMGDIKVSPGRATFAGRGGPVKEAIIVLASLKDRPFKVTDITSLTPNFLYSLETNTSGSRYTLRLYLSDKFTEGKLDDLIEITYLSEEKTETVSIPVIVNVQQGKGRASPQRPKK